MSEIYLDSEQRYLLRIKEQINKEGYTIGNLAQFILATREPYKTQRHTSFDFAWNSAQCLAKQWLHNWAETDFVETQMMQLDDDGGRLVYADETTEDRAL
jgi:hypothetical protein